MRTEINNLLNTMTQRELSEKIGIDQRYISAISTGAYVPPKIRDMEGEIMRKLDAVARTI